MKQLGCFDIEECLARFSGLGISLKHFPGLWILRRSVLIWRKLWPGRTNRKAAPQEPPYALDAEIYQGETAG